MQPGDLPTRRAGPGRPRKTSSPTEGAARAEIIAAASRLFSRRGVGATTMAEIADAAGLGASSIYYWFRSKQQILEEIVVVVNREPLDFAARVARLDGSPAARLWRLVAFDAEALCRFPFDINEIHRLAGDGDVSFDRYWRDRQRLHDTVEQLISEAIDAGELRPMDARLAALTVLANDEAVQNWYRPVGENRLALRGGGGPVEYTPGEIAAFVADMTVRGLLREPMLIDDVRRSAEALMVS